MSNKKGIQDIKMIRGGCCLIILSVLWVFSVESFAHTSAHIKTDPTKKDFNLNEMATVKASVLDKSDSTKVKNKIITEKPVIPIDVQYHLDSISSIGDKKRALINNKWSEVGTKIGVIELMSIHTTSVIVKKDDQTYELKLKQSKSVFEKNNQNKESTIKAVGDENE
ncbi:hypothetical protein [Marinicellulosiphila megalodicopiae]|uniref:hypothetical protein n=1 Tax=Marinicellulosiphila megalodicopiae TaxID=2724896 RepID=UPI003BAE2102